MDNERIYSVSVQQVAGTGDAGSSPAAPKAGSDQAFLAQEHQTLVRHFEEIYKTNLTALSLAATASGVLMAYFGPTWQSGLVVLAIVPIAFVYFGLIAPSFDYTAQVRTRLATVERQLAGDGLFVKWHEEYDKKGRRDDMAIKGAFYLLLLASALFGAYILLALDRTPTPTEVVVRHLSGKVTVETKFSNSPTDEQLRDLMQRLKKLDARAD